MLRATLRDFSRSVGQLRRRTAGQDLIEYALLIALIAATVLISVTGLGVKVPGFYEKTAAALPGQGPAGESPDPGGQPKGNPGNDKPAGDAGEDPSGKGN